MGRHARVTSRVSLKVSFQRLLFHSLSNCICVIAFPVCDNLFGERALAWRRRHHLILWQ